MHTADFVPTPISSAMWALSTSVDSAAMEASLDLLELSLQPAPFEAAPPVAQRPLRVRPFTAEDAPAFLEAVLESVDTVGQWLPWCHAGYTLEDAVTWMTSCRNFWEGGFGYNFAVVDDRTGEFLGSVGIDRIDQEHLNANVGYWIKASAAGQGVAPAAVDLILPFAFFELKLHRLEVVALCANLPSIRVAQKLGAQFECIARHRVMLWNQPYDAAVYSLLPIDVWPAPLEEAGPLLHETTADLATC
ncbi:MAG: ribosomal-protein-serine acetyltransferase [Rhizobacter sp.]|nr:ribosomal-protein-serine acetyltransferase [Rhizobacter sp.]